MSARAVLAGLKLTLLVAPLVVPLVVLAPLAARAQAGTPSAPIETLNQALGNAEKTSAQPFKTRYDAMAPVIDQAFDLPQILKTIVGLRWSEIPADQQQTLLAVFRAFTICNYVARTSSGFTPSTGRPFCSRPGSHRHAGCLRMDGGTNEGQKISKSLGNVIDPYALIDEFGP